MGRETGLAERFEESRAHLRGVAYRMLGSLSEAEDAVQEAWLRLSRSEPVEVANLQGWLTTVVARICLDMLRSRKSRPEELAGPQTPDAVAAAMDPEHEAEMADAVGLALLVVLDTLDPAERLAFVLHDMFAMPFEEIARIVGRSEAAARQLASRARRRIQGGAAVAQPELVRQREVVEAFLAASRAGDFDGLLAVLDPDVVVRTDGAAGGTREIRGARNWAKGAIAFSKAIRTARPALVDGSVGIVLARRGRLFRALRFRFAGGKIAEVDVVADPTRLAQIGIGVV